MCDEFLEDVAKFTKTGIVCAHDFCPAGIALRSLISSILLVFIVHYCCN